VQQLKLTIHWDGKKMNDVSHGSNRIIWERLAVCVSGVELTKILAVANIAEGTGEQQAEVITASLREWNVEDKIIAMGFDTTSSNTGRIAQYNIKQTNY
jgi:hypothetical protein